MEENESQPSQESSLDTTKQDEMTKRSRIRARIIKEIMESEKTYQRHLELVIQHFEGPLHDLNLVPDHVIVTIFSNVRQIVSVNQELVEHLAETGVGQAFLRMGPFFKLYSTYANNHERALGAMIEWEQKRPAFGAWRRQQEELPEMMGLKLNSLLITPVQRVPRYKLLLEDLLSNTDRLHDDYSAIEEAVKQISAVASHINEHIRQHDNFNKMLAIQKSLAGPGAPRILTPGRIFLKDGPLKKVSKKGGRSHERMFFLFSDILLYAKPKFVDQVLSGSYVCCCVFPLHHCKVDTVFGHSQSSGSLFTVTCKNESLLLYSDQKSVQSWVSVLRKAIQNLQVCRQTLRKPSSALQPLRRPGLVQLRKQQKKKDQLEHAKLTPERISHSPRSIKRALAEANINCLTPRKQRRTSPQPHMRHALSPIYSDLDESVSYQLDPNSENRNKAPAHPETQGKSRQKRMAQKLMTHIRHIGGRHRERVVCENEGRIIKPFIISPEPKKQGPDCDIEEILDPAQPKWDIFDTAPPDTTMVWRHRLDTDPPELRRPVVTPKLRARATSFTDAASLQRPRSEISENTSRIWKARPDSDISDDFDDTASQNVDDSRLPVLRRRPLRSPNTDEDSAREFSGRCGSPDRSSQTLYTLSSREFLSSCEFERDGSPTPKIYHKQSESMLVPYRTQWLTPSPPHGRDRADYRSYINETSETGIYSPSEQADVLGDEWCSSNYADRAYPDSDCSTPPRLGPLHEDLEESPEVGHSSEPQQADTPVTPKTLSRGSAAWKVLETAGEAANKVIQSPVLLKGEACSIQ